jgi:hypothetical protein
MGRTIKQMYKDIEDLNRTTNQQDLTNIYNSLHLITAEYTFFSTHMEHSLE